MVKINFLYNFNKYVTKGLNEYTRSYAPILRSSIYLIIQNLGLLNEFLEAHLDCSLTNIFCSLKVMWPSLFLFCLDLIYDNNSALNLSSISMYQITI